jgi:hypothetical protein
MKYIEVDVSFLVYVVIHKTVPDRLYGTGTSGQY